MAFLDNSGDILLDAVLTDTGRMRMARGDFNIVKFAFGDDEINYGLFEINHTSGSAYQDLKILQTPVFEAFTNNTSVMKSKLMTIGRTNLLYLPKLLVNTVQSPVTTDANNKNTYLVVANKTLRDKMSGTESTGYMHGDGDPTATPKNTIVIDQGIVDADEDQTINAVIDPDLRETQFIIKMDHRLLRMAQGDISPKKQAIWDSTTVGGRTQPIFIDDDHIAHYAKGMSDSGYVRTFGELPGTDQTRLNNWTSELVHEGPLGSRLWFRLESSEAAKTSQSLYTKLGTVAGTTVIISGGTEASVDFIDTIVRVTGVTTGYSIDIPVRIVRKV